MRRQLELNTPVASVNLEVSGWSRRRLIMFAAVFYVFAVLLMLFLGWLYVYPIAEHVGFEKAVLIGLAVIGMGVFME